MPTIETETPTSRESALLGLYLRCREINERRNRARAAPPLSLSLLEQTLFGSASSSVAAPYSAVPRSAVGLKP